MGGWRLQKELERVFGGLTTFYVNGTNLNVHGVQLKLHLAGHDGVHASRETDRFVAINRHRGELVGQHRDLCLKRESE